MFIPNNKAKKWIGFLNQVFEKTSNILKISASNIEANIGFVSNKEIKQLNKQFRGIDKETDVLSFPNLLAPKKAGEQIIASKINLKNFRKDVNPESGKIMLGDIVICPRVLKKQSKVYQHSYERELAFVVTHGLLHLVGFSHEEEDDAKVRMRVAEEKILLALNLTRDGK